MVKRTLLRVKRTTSPLLLLLLARNLHRARLAPKLVSVLSLRDGRTSESRASVEATALHRANTRDSHCCPPFSVPNIYNRDDALRGWRHWHARNRDPPRRPGASVMADSPQFVIKATDKFALYIISAYRRFCMAHGMHEQAAEVAKAIDEIALWQKENPELV